MSKKIISINFSSSRRPSILNDFLSYNERKVSSERDSMSRYYEGIYWSGEDYDEDYWDDINSLFYGGSSNRDLSRVYGYGSSIHPSEDDDDILYDDVYRSHKNSEYYDEDGNYISRRERIKKKSRARKRHKNHSSHSRHVSVDELRLNEDTQCWETYNPRTKCWETSDIEEPIVDSDSVDIGSEMKKIMYYEDIHSEPRVFGNLFELDSFLTSEGIETPESEMAKLINNYEIHCCINPRSLREHGDKELISDTSYGCLRWSIDVDDSYEEV